MVSTPSMMQSSPLAGEFCCQKLYFTPEVGGGVFRFWKLFPPYPPPELQLLMENFRQYGSVETTGTPKGYRIVESLINGLKLEAHASAPGEIEPVL